MRIKLYTMSEPGHVWRMRAIFQDGQQLMQI